MHLPWHDDQGIFLTAWSFPLIYDAVRRGHRVLSFPVCGKSSDWNDTGSLRV